MARCAALASPQTKRASVLLFSIQASCDNKWGVLRKVARLQCLDSAISLRRMQTRFPPPAASTGRHPAGLLTCLQGEKRPEGAALVIVLAFVVLLVGLLVAFFSRAVSQRQISDSYANQIKVDLLARAAVDIVVGDFKQEIVAGSVISNPATGVTIYAPLVPANAVPCLSGTIGGVPFPPNLIKLSGTAPVFSVSGSNGTVRGTRLTSATPSLNGRCIEGKRWNAALLLPSISGSNKSPLASGSAPGIGLWALPNVSGSFAGPCWVLVARDGTNPTDWNPSVIWSRTNPTTVIGRYAYAIYDEGGLLDMNVAGYPSGAASGSANALDLARKGSLAFADLTQLPLTAGTLSQADVDKILAWRNTSVVPTAASAATLATGSNYLLSIRSATNGFLTVSGTSDRAFISRQSLIQFLTSRTLSLSTADAQNLLQYMGTFSRALEQPSYAPPALRPLIVPPAGDDNITFSAYPASPDTAPLGKYRGGNDGYGGDSLVNPSLAATRVNSSFPRNDGTTAKEGEPLVLKRFALNRLAWLTCKGPSEPRKASNDADIKALKDAGISEDWLAQGTDANILKYFGLAWQTSTPAPLRADHEPGGFWRYEHGIKTGTNVIVGTLEKVCAANREPDFFELVKAAINAGSLAKAAAPECTYAYDAGAYCQLRDKTLDYQVLQIGANIIDQYDTDGYPTRIAFFNPAERPIVIRGCENLPYLYRLRWASVQLADANSIPNPDPADHASLTVDITSTINNYTGNQFRPGNLVILGQPELWNPHDQGSSLGIPNPTAFRIYAESMDPSGNTAYSDNNMVYAKSALGAMLLSSSQSAVNISGWGDLLSNYTSLVLTSSTTPDTTASVRAANHHFALPLTPYYASTATTTTGTLGKQLAGSELLFDAVAPASNIFNEPTLLGEKNTPSGINLRAGPNNAISLGGYTGYNGSLHDRATGKDLVGFYMTELPLRWIHYDTGQKKYFLDTVQEAGFGAFNVTVRIQCQDPSGNWITYSERYFRNVSGTYDWVNFNNLNPAPNSSPYFVNTHWNGFDPRTERWGTPVFRGGNYPKNWPMPFGITDRPAAVTGSCVSTRCVPGNPSQIQDAAHDISAQIGWFTGPFFISPTYLRPGDFTQNVSTISGQQYYADADDIVRRAMGGYATTSGSTGLPMYAGNNASRPIILNRPFRSVAELGYVFKGTPWKNIDFFTPETGDAALLDVFCISEPQSVMVAGRVNLNTRQAPVLRAILARALKDELDTTGADAIQTDLDTIAPAVIARTTSTNISKGPFANVSELAGRLVGKNVSGYGPEAYQSTDRNGAAWVYSGLSAEITGSSVSYSDDGSRKIQRRSEAAIRALADVGQTRVWNLMIDLVAQVGKYPPAAAAAVDPLFAFVVQGEKRYWYHVAIDRLTGEVLDCSLENVSE